VLLSGKDQPGGVDWQHARSMLNGRLERIEQPLDKGRRLLEEAIGADPAHEEAQLYLAFLHNHEGKRMTAAQEYQRVFDTALNETNRGHAAIQIGRLYFAEKNYRKAIVCWRWVTMSGLVDNDDRFFVARFNLGMTYALLRNQARSLHYFCQLLKCHPSRAQEVAQLFARSPQLRESIDSQRGFAEALFDSCPELFVRPAVPEGGDGNQQGAKEE
jgi:tetratricopeptide (TPR) repeat protein